MNALGDNAKQFFDGWDAVDEASWESFPASDPPAFTSPNRKGANMKTQVHENLGALYIDQISDLYDAEKQLVHALPKIAEKATSKRLRQIILSHLDETKNQVKRLEDICESHKWKLVSQSCKAMKGLLAEGDDELKKWHDSAVKDAAIIACAQRIEHYEMSAYGTAISFAGTLGYKSDAASLHETMQEERAADSKLNDIATSDVNIAAMAS